MNNNGLNYSEFLTAISDLDPETFIRFDFGGLIPCGYHSYRGYYEDCAIGFGQGEMLAGEYALELKSMLGKPLYGWKGGEWKIHKKTSLWVSGGPSECTGTIITSIKDSGYGYAIIGTSNED